MITRAKTQSAPSDGPRPVIPSELPHTVGETRRLDSDELDPERIRTRALGITL